MVTQEQIDAKQAEVNAKLNELLNLSEGVNNARKAIEDHPKRNALRNKMNQKKTALKNARDDFKNANHGNKKNKEKTFLLARRDFTPDYQELHDDVLAELSETKADQLNALPIIHAELQQLRAELEVLKNEE